MNQSMRSRDMMWRGDRGDREWDDNMGGGGGGGGGSMGGARERSRSPIIDRRDIGKGFVTAKNVPQHYGWAEFKSLIMNMVDGVSYVKMMPDEKNPRVHRGTASIRFDSVEEATHAVNVLNGFKVDGKILQLKLEKNPPRKSSKLQTPNKQNMLKKVNKTPRNGSHQSFGLNMQFLEGLNIKLPLTNRVFVSNLNNQINEFKLKEVFKLAGKVENIDVPMEISGIPQGYAFIEYSHPVEAVQAVSMFNGQLLYDQPMNVKMSDKLRSDSLPKGLRSIGPGLGENGQPLRDIAKAFSGSSMNETIGESTSDMSMMKALPSASSFNNSNVDVSPFGLQGVNVGLNQMQQIIQQTIGASLLNNMIGQATGNLPNNNIPPLMVPPFNNGPPNQGKYRIEGNSTPNKRESMNNVNQGCSVVVARLPNNLSRKLIEDKFSEVGHISSIDKIDQSTVIIHYSDTFSADRAIKTFDKMRVQGTTINVKHYY